MGYAGSALVLLCAVGSTACVHASTGRVRKASGTTLCVENMVVVVEVVQNVGNRHIIEPLRAHLQARGVIAHMVDVDSVSDLRQPNISGPIGTHEPQAVLVIDWIDAGLWGTGVLQTNSDNNFKLSLYQYTQEHNLVEVWKSNLRSARAFTASPSLEPKEGDAIALEVVEELGKSMLIAPCENGGIE